MTTFEVENLEVQKGQSIGLDVDGATGKLKVERTGGDAPASYRLKVTREHEDGRNESFTNDQVPIGKGLA